jgi:hypothetical protein
MPIDKYRQRLAVFFNETPALAQAGFYLSAGTSSIDRPFHFEVDKLADAYPDFDEILTPLDAALDDVFKVWEKFDALIKQLLKMQGEKNGAI